MTADFPRRAIGGGLGCLLLALGLAGRVEAADEGSWWRSVESLDFAGVLAATTPANDSAALARAVALLNRQPRTGDNVGQARRDLAALAENAADPDVRAAAAYARVRADDAFERHPDYPAVEAAYAAVAAAHPDHVFGELALARAMTLSLTRNRAGRDIVALAGAWHPRIAALRDPAVRRTALVTLATALIAQREAPHTAAAWLAEARYEEFLRWDFRWRTQLRDTWLALVTEDRERARALAESFAERFPRSPRIELLRGLTEGRLPVP